LLRVVLPNQLSRCAADNLDRIAMLIAHPFSFSLLAVSVLTYDELKIILFDKETKDVEDKRSEIEVLSKTVEEQVRK
jgi:hypothetical protein